MKETQRQSGQRITRKHQSNMSNKSGKQHVLGGVATRGALGRTPSDASGYKVYAG
jgi:hypothetical protein